MSKHVVVRSKSGNIKLTRVHSSVMCSGKWCVVHNPMAPTRSRYLTWRDDRGIFEDVCWHGVGHPSPEQLDFWNETNREWEAVHGCCGCCGEDGCGLLLPRVGGDPVPAAG